MRHNKLSECNLTASIIGAVLFIGFFFAGDPSYAKELEWHAESEAGIYRVTFKPVETPIPMRKFHNWIIEIYDAKGHPVQGTRVSLDGGMPEHGHGLPSRPKLSATANPGVYLVEGMKFNMGGKWRLELSVIQPQVDKAVFEIQLSY